MKKLVIDPHNMSHNSKSPGIETSTPGQRGILCRFSDCRALIELSRHLNCPLIFVLGGSGPHPESDSIISVGAVKFSGSLVCRWLRGRVVRVRR